MTCCSADGRRTSTSGPPRTRTRSSGCSGTAGSSAAAFVSLTCASGPKTIEVATFRRQLTVPRIAAPDEPPRRRPRTRRPTGGHDADAPSRQHVRHARGGCVPARFHDQRPLLRHRDFSIIDYTGGLGDLEEGLDASHRGTGRTVPGGSRADAARGGRWRPASISTRSAGRRGHRGASRALARSVAGEAHRGVSTSCCGRGAPRAFRMLAAAPAGADHAGAEDAAGPALWKSLARSTRYRQQFPTTRPSLTNTDSARDPSPAARL